MPHTLPRVDPAEHADRATIRLLLVVSVALITFAAFEALAVATAMPTVSRELDGDQLYALAFGITLATQVATTPAAGQWCDSGGTRAALMTGVGTFVVGLLVAGLAPSMWILVLGRAVQGIGGALVIVPLYVLVGTVVPEQRRPGFFAAFSAAWVVPSLVGPLLAGFLAEHVSWRWVFLGVAGVAIPASFLVVAVLRRIGHQQAAAEEALAGALAEPPEATRAQEALAGALAELPEATRAQVPEATRAQVPHPAVADAPDEPPTSISAGPAPTVTGAAATDAPAAEVAAVDRGSAVDGPAPDRDPQVSRSRPRRAATYLAIGAGVGAALLQSAGAAPGERVGLTAADWIALALGAVALALCVPGLLPPGALRLRPRVPALITGRALLNGSFIGVEIFLVLLLQEQHGWGAMAAGLVLTVGSLSWGLGSLVAARVRTEEVRGRLPWIGTTMLAVGIAVVLPASWPELPAWLTIVGWVVAGGGIGLAMSASSVLALGWTIRERQGEVSAHLQIADALGAAVLVALTGLAVAIVPLGSSGQIPYLAALGIGLALSIVSAAASYRSQGLPRRR